MEREIEREVVIVKSHILAIFLAVECVIIDASSRFFFYIICSSFTTDNVTSATEMMVGQSTQQQQMESTTSLLLPVTTSIDLVSSTRAVSTPPLVLSSTPRSLAGAVHI